MRCRIQDTGVRRLAAALIFRIGISWSRGSFKVVYAVLTVKLNSILFCPMQPKRKSQRKRGYDYSQPGYYAVTVSTQNRSCLFGMIGNGDMRLNDAGRMIDKTCHEIPDHYPDIELDLMQIMPNHLHGIIVVREVGTDPCVCPFS